MPDFTYVGRELALFERATNWKRYLRSELAPYVRGDVLEVGAGIGANTRLFEGLEFTSWLCLEPDRRLLAELQKRLPSRERYAFVVGTTADVHAWRFDLILYVDVLEHIEDDRAEMQRVVALLKPGGAVIVVAPAHDYLFSAFDEAVGHYRRYTKDSLTAVIPPALRLEKLVYLDSLGLLASLGNRMLLRNRLPTQAQILVWDRILVTCSRVTDRLVMRRLGKSVMGIWRMP